MSNKVVKEIDKILVFLGDNYCSKCHQFKPIWDAMQKEPYVYDNYFTTNVISNAFIGNMPNITDEYILTNLRGEPLANEEKYDRAKYGVDYELLKERGELPVRKRIEKKPMTPVFAAVADKIPKLVIVSSYEYCKKWDIETGKVVGTEKNYKIPFKHIIVYEGRLAVDGKPSPELKEWLIKNKDHKW